MTKYRLKKDLPTLKAGTLFTSGMYNRDGGEDADVEVLEFGDYEFRRDEIDNFDEWFEEIKESGWWKPQEDDGFWSISSDGTSFANIWGNDCYDNGRMDIGNVFKTEEAADRFANYLKAIATVRQDEGVLTPEQIHRLEISNGQAYHVALMGNQNGEKVLGSCAMDFYDIWAPAGVILFDTEEHADASRKKHLEEWKVIANYDWSRE